MREATPPVMTEDIMVLDFPGVVVMLERKPQNFCLRISPEMQQTTNEEEKESQPSLPC